MSALSVQSQVNQKTLHLCGGAFFFCKKRKKCGEKFVIYYIIQVVKNVLRYNKKNGILTEIKQTGLVAYAICIKGSGVYINIIKGKN